MSDYGPHDYFDSDKPPSRGQYKAIALLAVTLLGLPEPESRLDASVLIARLRDAHAKSDDVKRARQALRKAA